MRAELAEAVYDYFAVHGFDEVTVDEVSHGVGISRATFFRYFGSKEEAVLVAVYSSPLDFAARLRSLERTPGESLWALVRRMFASSVLDTERRPEALRARVRMINATPTLKSRLADRRVSQIVGVTEVLTESATDALAARALAATAFALFDVAWGAWSASEDLSFGAVLDDLFARFAPAAEATFG